MSCNLQDWIEVSKALLTPVIAIFGIVLGFRQYKVSKDKLKLDLYDRRYKVFYCIASCLEQAVRDGTATNELLIKFNVGTRDIPFLFDGSIVELEKEIRDKLIKLKFHENAIKSSSGAKQSDHIDITANAFSWIVAEMNNLQMKMAPWLSFSHLR